MNIISLHIIERVYSIKTNSDHYKQIKYILVMMSQGTCSVHYIYSERHEGIYGHNFDQELEYTEVQIEQQQLHTIWLITHKILSIRKSFLILS